MPSAIKNIGYNTNSGTLGTVNANVNAMITFNNQLVDSNISLVLLLFQSLCINSTVLCQSKVKGFYRLWLKYFLKVRVRFVPV